MAHDAGKQDDPDWKPLFEGCRAVARWLAEKKPDVLFFCFNDHATTFFFDHYPTFALGVSDEYAIADEGRGRSRGSGATRRSRVTSRARWSPTSSTSRSSRDWRSTTGCTRRSA